MISVGYYKYKNIFITGCEFDNDIWMMIDRSGGALGDYDLWFVRMSF